MLEHLLVLLSSISGYNNSNSAAVSENKLQQIEKLSEIVLNDNNISDKVKCDVVNRLLVVEKIIGKDIPAINHIIDVCN